MMLSSCFHCVSTFRSTLFLPSFFLLKGKHASANVGASPIHLAFWIKSVRLLGFFRVVNIFLLTNLIMEVLHVVRWQLMLHNSTLLLSYTCFLIDVNEALQVILYLHLVHGGGMLAYVWVVLKLLAHVVHHSIVDKLSKLGRRRNRRWYPTGSRWCRYLVAQILLMLNVRLRLLECNSVLVPLVGCSLHVLMILLHAELIRILRRNVMIRFLLLRHLLKYWRQMLRRVCVRHLVMSSIARVVVAIDALNVWLLLTMMVVVMMIMVGEVIFAWTSLYLVLLASAMKHSWVCGWIMARFHSLLLAILLREHHLFHLLNGHCTLDVDPLVLDHMFLFEL